MKLTRNIWRVNNDMKIKEEKQRHSRFRFGAIIEYENTILSSSCKKTPTS